MATLFIFAGLPAFRKSTLFRLLARELNAVHLRIDTVEQALRELCRIQVQGEGYRLSYRIAADNLRVASLIKERDDHDPLLGSVNFLPLDECEAERFKRSHRPAV